MKPGIKTSEFYVTLVTILGVLGTVVEVIQNSNMLQGSPIAAAILAGIGAFSAAILGKSYTDGRSAVKAADDSVIG